MGSQPLQYSKLSRWPSLQVIRTSVQNPYSEPCSIQAIILYITIIYKTFKDKYFEKHCQPVITINFDQCITMGRRAELPKRKRKKHSCLVFVTAVYITWLYQSALKSKQSTCNTLFRNYGVLIRCWAA